MKKLYAILIFDLLLYARANGQTLPPQPPPLPPPTPTYSITNTVTGEGFSTYYITNVFEVVEKVYLPAKTAQFSCTVTDPQGRHTSVIHRVRNCEPDLFMFKWERDSERLYFKHRVSHDDPWFIVGQMDIHPSNHVSQVAVEIL